MSHYISVKDIQIMILRNVVKLLNKKNKIVMLEIKNLKKLLMAGQRL